MLSLSFFWPFPTFGGIFMSEKWMQIRIAMQNKQDKELNSRLLTQILMLTSMKSQHPLFFLQLLINSNTVKWHLHICLHPNRPSPASWGGHDAENRAGVQAEWVGSDCAGGPLPGHALVPGGRSPKGEVNTHYRSGLTQWHISTWTHSLDPSQGGIIPNW